MNQTNQKAFARSEPLLFPKPNPSLSYSLKVDPTHPWLKQRGLKEDTISEFGLGHCAGGPLQNRIAIPVHDAQARLVGYAGRSAGEPTGKRSKYKFITAGYLDTELFNLHRVLEERAIATVILVTGFFDVMHLWQLGCRNVVALMGCQLASAQIARLVHHFPIHRVIALFDETDYGRAARESALRELPTRAFVHVARFRQEGRLVESLASEELEEL